VLVIPSGLRVGQLDFTARTLAVTETVVRGRKGAVGFGEPKSSAGRRTLAVPAELMDMLVELRSRDDRAMDARSNPLLAKPCSL